MYFYDDCGCLLLFIILSVVFGGRYGWLHYHPHGCLWFLFPYYWSPFYDPLYSGGGWSPWSAKRKRKEKTFPLPPVKKIRADTGFSDETIDGFIAAGKLSEARESMKSMLQIAREMNDKQMEANYRAYGEKIKLASWKAGRVARKETVATSPEPPVKPPPPPEPPEDDGVSMEFME